MAESVERTAFGSHNHVRFFSEKLAKKDIGPLSDYFLRDPVTNETPLMVVIKGEDPKKIYTAMLGLSDMVGDYMDGLMRTQPNVTSRAAFVTTLEYIKDHYHDGKQPVMGLVELVECESKPSGNAPTGAQDTQGSQSGSEKNYRVKCEGLAAFKDNRLAGYMDGIEARAYNFVRNKLKSAFITIPSAEGQTVVKVVKSKSDIKTTVKGEQATLDVKVKVEMNIIQQSGLTNITKPEPLKTVQDRFNKQTEKEIAAAVRKAQQEFQSDIFGFGVAVHMQHPEKWKKIKQNWDHYFSKAVINVTVESSAVRSGEIKEPFEMENPP
jgi:spore germination protein KC